jgi:hypothetical protein
VQNKFHIEKFYKVQVECGNCAEVFTCAIPVGTLIIDSEGICPVCKHKAVIKKKMFGDMPDIRHIFLNLERK